MDIILVEEKIEWEKLVKAWQECKLAMIEAENEIDAEVMSFLNGDGAKPDRALLSNLEELRHHEYQARGVLDHFIDELG